MDIFAASSVGDIKRLRYLIDSEVDINQETSYGSNALIYASTCGNTKCLKLIVNTGKIKDINKFNDLNINALFGASRYNHIENVKILIKAGADIYCKDEYGDTILNEARIRGRVEIVKIIEDKMINDLNFLSLSHDILRHIIEKYL